MKSGHGRLTLRDGTDLPFEYRLVRPVSGSRCQGSLIGDMTKLNPLILAERLRFVSDDGASLSLLVTHHSDRHLTFIGDFEPASPNSHANSQLLSRISPEEL